ncbi:ABC transporter permease [Zavarzinia compransoris]|uniref:ABC transporter ATP-binding protein n=1 Tax=Zavarzinia compransoris TaxID=1264899 RepID=A0A317E3G0_9PROT|nr:ABC transporter permease subunit [Zavarzinia compransoris]PWR20730.1 ABC transporter ATP-binding protein [Zavarzinia compransoris]TDP44438.1 NitT/TauT family transport system permease protein [Zavarzinia compransoris]
MTARLLSRAAPAAVALLVLGGWEALVRFEDLPAYILPAPSRIAATLWTDRAILAVSLLVTLKTTFAALVTAAAASLLLAVLFRQSRWIERSLYPYAVILQVTPIVAIAPLILIYVEDPFAVMLVCATIVAFFPILANTMLGLRAVDPGLEDLFRLQGAGRWRTLWLLHLPSALPYFLAGLRIAGGLALIGAVVAEFVSSTTAGGATGLAWRIIEAGQRLNVPRMFAALALIAGAGIAIFAALTALSQFVLRRWHDSARQGQGGN